MNLLRERLMDPISSEYTLIPAFILNYEGQITKPSYQEMLNDSSLRTPAFYFHRTKQYYSIKPQAQARDGKLTDQTLPIEIHTPFVLQDHAAIIADHTALYLERYTALTTIDQRIMTALVLSLIATCTPFIPFVGLVSTIAWSTTLYLISQRFQLVTEYKDALTLLVTTCNWALGSVKINAINHPKQLAKNPEITGMLNCLYPVLTKKQVKHLIDDTIEAEFEEALTNYNSRFKFPLVSRFFNNANSRTLNLMDRELEETALKQHGADFIRCLYGLNHVGNTSEILRILVVAIPDFFRAAYNIVKARYTAETPEQVTIQPV